MQKSDHDKTALLCLCFCISKLLGSHVKGGGELPTQALRGTYRLAAKHDLAHLVCTGSGQNQGDPVRQGLYKQFQMAMYRYVQQSAALDEISGAFNEEGIPFLPLKGSVLRNHYPEPWMRTCGDMDILIHPSDFERARETLVEQCGLKFESANKKDAQFYGPSGVHLELHFVLISDTTVWALQPDMIWSHCTHNGFCYTMADEDFYAYHLIHMRNHFLTGGCGIRSVLDLWILNHRVEHDEEKRNAKLAECGLTEFAAASVHLSEVWFGMEEHTPLTQSMEDYIVGAGVYGSVENWAQVRQAQNDGKAKSLFKRLWLPYDRLIWDYPKLEGRRYLQPYYEAKRFFKMVFSGRIGRSVQELNVNRRMDKLRRKKLQSMLEQLGIL